MHVANFPNLIDLRWRAEAFLLESQFVPAGR